ncbi:prolyl oligopeptidase [Phlyctema vagabunda]|uniref:Prolyl oligopeptidase n=1 Tax=Phlyctema vagabunda TaxID=108571 RepID=A0ABR4PSK2_9HELO
MAKTEAPFGTWESPITSELLTAQSVDLGGVYVSEAHEKIYYHEGRSAEGRSTIVEYSTEGVREVLPTEYSAGSSIHEYGGGSLCVGSDGNVVFVNGRTQVVYSLIPSTKEVKPITEVNHSLRWADFDVHPRDTKWVLALRENHAVNPVENVLAVINADTKKNHVVAQGADFYKSARFSPDGKKVCWIQWNHPDMPWTGTELYVADWHDGRVSEPQYIAGKAIIEAIDEPVWGPDGTLFFISDRTKFLQLYRLDPGESEARKINLKGLESAEFSGRCPWVASSTYVVLTTTTIVAAYAKNATNHLIVIDLKSETWKDLGIPLNTVRYNAMRRVSDTSFAVIGTGPKVPQALYRVDLAAPSDPKLIKSSSEIKFSEAYLSEAEHISFPRTHGDVKEGTCHCLLRLPNNEKFQGVPGTLPPLIVSLHGGPTNHTPPGLALTSQYWTSRGYAWVDINYTGSSGYGREYRDALNGLWGVADTDDSASCVAYLASAGLVDGTRVGIRGGSAGGYGVLQALCMYPNTWAGGVSEFGVSDVKALAADTHKFESHYLFKLLFKNGKDGLDDAEIERVYHERSPVYHADRITAPVLLLQGTEDKIVPPNQTLKMEEIIKEKGGEVKVVMFPGEGHGFGGMESVKRALAEEEAWWKRTLVK